MRVLVVIPTYQEVGNIETVLRRVRASCPIADVLVVDDSSGDGTAEAARAVADDLGGITVLERPGKSGLGSAYREGFGRALEEGYDAVVEIDADLSHDPAALPGLLAPLSDGAGLVIGSRYIPGGAIPHWPRSRRMLSRFGNLYASTLLGFDIADATSGYRVYAAETLRSIDLRSVRSDGYGFQVEMAFRAGRRGNTVVEVPITFHDRTEGSSKMSWRIIAEAVVLVAAWSVRYRLLRRDLGAPIRSHVPLADR